ncbi:hypothetical protein SK128_006367, partial [Halocaridina rubra]
LMSNYGKIVGNISTILGEDDRRIQFWRTTLTEPLAQILGMSVDVDMYGEVNRAMHEALNHYVKATRDRKEAVRQTTESPSPVATTQPAFIAPSGAGPSNSFGHTVAPPLAPLLHVFT